MKEPKLKLCPFCGGVAMIHYYPQENLAWVKCENCKASSGMASVLHSESRTKNMAIGKWNRRVLEVPVKWSPEDEFIIDQIMEWKNRK